MGSNFEFADIEIVTLGNFQEIGGNCLMHNV